MQGTIMARAHDDAPAVSLALDQALRKWDGLLDLLPIGIYTCNVDGTIVHYNQRAVELWGGAPPAGQSYCGAVRAFAASGEPLTPEAMAMGEVLRSGRPVRNREIAIERPEGTRIDILVNAEPVFGEDGRLVGGVNCFQDISARKRAEGAADARERWHGDVLEALPAAIYTTDAEGKITFFNAAAARLWGVTPKLGSDAWCGSWRLFWPDGRPMRHDECPMAITLKTDRPVGGMSALAERPDGTRVPFVPYPTPLHDAEGRLVGAVNMLMDMSEQQRHAAALAGETGQLETLNRIGAQLVAGLDLEKLVQAVTDAGVALTGAAFGAFFYNVQDAEGARYTLYTLSGVPREAFERFPMPRKTAIFAPTFDGTGTVRSDDILADPRYGQNAPHAGMPKGHLPVRSYLAVPVVSRSGEVLGGLFFGHPERGVFTGRAERTMEAVAAQAAIAIDNARLFQSAQREIAERKQAEARLRVMLDELNHRVKNTLATVQSLAAHTFRGTKVPAALRQSFEGRLFALSRIHNQLARTHWETADLQAILGDVFAPFAGDGHHRVRLSGGAVKLAPDTALVLAIALHELATNAAKYGSLSSAEGRLDVSWSVSEGTGNDTLRIAWTEQGGPPVRKPSRRGFGTQLLERGIGSQLKGEAEIVFDPAGVRYTMVLPLPAARNAADGNGRDVPREAA